MRRSVLAALLWLAVMTTVMAITYHYQITHIGTIQTIGVKVYADDGQTVLTTLDWGNVYVGNTYQLYGYLKSTSSVNATVQYTTYDLPSYLTFNLYYQTGYWNNNVWVPTGDWTNLAENPYLIQPNEWLRLKFELIVGSNAVPGSFSFTVIIIATS